MIAEQARKRKLDNLKQNNQSPKSSKEDNGKIDRSGKTGAILGKIAGTSESSISRTKKILEKGTPDEIERARKGGRGNSICTVLGEIERREIEEKNV